MTAFFENNLKQNYKEIRESRAKALTEDTEIEYRRAVEDKYRRVRNIDRAVENQLLDLCPKSTTSTQVGPADYKADEFVKRDLQNALDRREMVIELEVTVDRYEYYFGPYKQADQIKEVSPTWKSKITNEEPKNEWSWAVAFICQTELTYEERSTTNTLIKERFFLEQVWIHLWTRSNRSANAVKTQSILRSLQWSWDLMIQDRWEISLHVLSNTTSSMWWEKSLKRESNVLKFASLHMGIMSGTKRLSRLANSKPVMNWWRNGSNQHGLRAKEDQMKVKALPSFIILPQGTRLVTQLQNAGKKAF